MTALVWFRRDLRLADNPAWVAATRDHDRVIALFVIDPALWHQAPTRRTDLLAAHLASLDRRLAERSGRLRVLTGEPGAVVPQEAAGLEAVYWNNDYTPYALARDATVAGQLPCAVIRHEGVAFHPPGVVVTGDGGPYRVFTPYWRRWREEPWELSGEEGAAAIGGDPGAGLPRYPPSLAAGEQAAAARLLVFLSRVDEYGEERDRPDHDGTSMLSTDLKFGTISPRRIRAEVGEETPGREAFVRQLCWRDFYLQIMASRPESISEPFRPEYRSIAWNSDEGGFAAWTQGRTGYPIVDATMRQLEREGWIHNRLRMIAASFLVKDLLIDWRRGERWFRRQLVDADVSQNVGNWQWVAGTGADAAPYFRVFNPVTQGRRFDPDGDYVRRWVPELGELDGKSIHAPWDVGPLELAAAGVILGDTYPAPIVDHGEARLQVIAAFERARREA